MHRLRWSKFLPEIRMPAIKQLAAISHSSCCPQFSTLLESWSGLWWRRWENRASLLFHSRLDRLLVTPVPLLSSTYHASNQKLNSLRWKIVNSTQLLPRHLGPTKSSPTPHHAHEYRPTLECRVLNLQINLLQTDRVESQGRRVIQARMRAS